MQWYGRELKTIGDMIWGINQCHNPEDALAFMALYRAENKRADSNIGYLSGYYGPEETKRIQTWFGVVHPISEGNYARTSIRRPLGRVP